MSVDEEAPPTKKTKLDSQSESCVIIDSLSTTATKTSTTTSTTSNNNTTTSSNSDIGTSSNSDVSLFYLTKVRGISSIYNKHLLAIGIKGTLCIQSICIIYCIFHITYCL